MSPTGQSRSARPIWRGLEPKVPHPVFRAVFLRSQSLAASSMAALLVMIGALSAAPAQAAPAKPQISRVTAGYAGTALFGTANYCDRSVSSTVRFRVIWRAYRVKDGTLWKTRHATFSTSAQCRTVGTTFTHAPQEYHYLVVTVSNLATGRSGQRRSATGTDS